MTRPVISVRIPTDADVAAYDGAHCRVLWRTLGEMWRCPGCTRTKRQIMRWTLRSPAGRRFWGWMAGVHRHHDHSQGVINIGLGRFPTVVVCDQCNAADGIAKRQLRLPADFSFSPEQIRQFVTAVPHGKHRIDLRRAAAVYGAWRANGVH